MRDSTRQEQLLHNMSCRPNAAINHTGKDLCMRLRIGVHPRTETQRSFADLCPWFGVALRRGVDAYAELTRAVSEPHPALQRLPPVASVLRNVYSESVVGLTDDPHLVLQVLSRCSSGVFLRDRPPVIQAERLAQPVSLLIPISWKLKT